MSKIQMVDLKGQYKKIQNEVDLAIQQVIESSQFINGDETKQFAEELAAYTASSFVIPCGNGTDALQIALMSLGVGPGDEIIVPSFTYVASAEVIRLLGAQPVFADVDPHTFNLDIESLESNITSKTRAIIAVHLFGQNSDMESLLSLSEQHNIYLIEDAAQSIGADYYFKDGNKKKSGTMGYIGCTSFFPSKNLGCYGDGGAIFTQNAELAEKIRMIANHGQNKKYHFRYVGVNSRLDNLQAAILRVKLKKLDQYTKSRQQAAGWYDEYLFDTEGVTLPLQADYSSHVFHQYTIKLTDKEKRDSLKNKLEKAGIPSMIYYPLPLHHQEAYNDLPFKEESLKNSLLLTHQVLSLPMHTELEESTIKMIAETIKNSI